MKWALTFLATLVTCGLVYVWCFSYWAGGLWFVVLPAMLILQLVVLRFLVKNGQKS